MAYETESALSSGVSNGSTELANPLQNGVYLQANLGSSTDKDYFTFTAVAASLLTLNFDTSVLDVTKHWQVAIVNANGDLVQALSNQNLGAPLVNGANQSGTSLTVDGFTTLPLAGSRFTLVTADADTTVYTATAVTGNLTQTTLSLDVSLPASLADNTRLQFNPAQTLTGGSTSLTAAVNAGVYYVLVSADNAVWDGSDYQLTASWTSTTEIAASNDTKSDAALNGSRLLANVPMSGNLSESTDVDYWVFSTAVASDFSIQFASSAAGSTDEWKIDITDWLENPLANNAGALRAGALATVTIDDAVYATPKTWLVKVSAVSPSAYNTGSYTLMVSGAQLDLNDTPVLTMGAARSSINSNELIDSGVIKSIAVGESSTGVLLTDLFDASDADALQSISSYNFQLERADSNIGAYIQAGQRQIVFNTGAQDAAPDRMSGNLTASEMAIARLIPGTTTGSMTFSLQANDNSGASDGSGSSGWLTETIRLTSQSVGFVVGEPSATTLTENLNPASGVPHSTSFTLKLNSAPTGDVKVYLLDDNQQLDPINALTFTVDNYNQNQTVTVTATQDNLAESGNQTAGLSFLVISNDTDYDGFAIAKKTFTVQDNAAPVFSNPTGLTVNDTSAYDTATTVQSQTALEATDANGDSITFGVLSGTVNAGLSTKAGTYGALTVNTTTGAYSYTPTSNEILNGLSSTVTDVFTVTAFDGTVTSTKSLVVTLNGVDEAPVGTDVTVLAYDWKGHSILKSAQVTVGEATAQSVGTQTTGVEFAGVLGDSVSLTASLSPDGNTHSAVDILDAIAILKMIVGLDINPAGQALSPYQAYAADFDASGEVNINDAIGVLKHIVGLDAPSPAWIFFNEMDSSIPAKASQALTTDALTVPALSQVVTSDASVGLVGVLRGDVNGSWTPADSTPDLDLVANTYFSDLVSSYNLAHPNANVSVAQWGILA